MQDARCGCGCGCQTPNAKRQTPNAKRQTPNAGRQTPDAKRRTSDARPPRDRRVPGRAALMRADARVKPARSGCTVRPCRRA
ncbi:hypothetical protein BOC51_01350 [Burkholderia pseudomallei]|nr:hypothetical protein BOC51_01350 [Burkholderia pseudomallei]